MSNMPWPLSAVRMTFLAGLLAAQRLVDRRRQGVRGLRTGHDALGAGELHAARSTPAGAVTRR